MFKEINFPLPGEFLRLLMRERMLKKKKREDRMTRDFLFMHFCAYKTELGCVGTEDKASRWCEGNF